MRKNLAIAVGLLPYFLCHPAVPAPSLQLSSLQPPELMEMVRLAVEHDQNEDAAAAFIVAMAYSSYDSKRTGSQIPRKIFAELAAMTLSALPAHKLAAFASAGRSLSNSPQRILGVLKEAGPPSYSPDYLGDPEITNLDFASSAAWEEVVANLAQGGLAPR